MASLASPPVVRTGKCSLILVIDSRRYRVSPAPPVVPGAKIWHLRVLSGQVRAGKVYSVCSVRRRVDCTCPDSTQNHAVCKHVRALQVLGLVAKTTKPSLVAAWEEAQPSRRRKPALPTLASPVPPPAVPPLPPVKATTRRNHVPMLQDDGTSFAAGFRDAVRSHLAGMSAAKGGVL
jgi:hypothetical protein